MATNLGLEFNKRVYFNLRKDPLHNAQYRTDNMLLYQKLITTKLVDLFPDQLNLKDKFGDSYQSFTLTTSGQGFLIGTGNEHGTGSKVKVRKVVNGQDRIEEIESHEFKMGFHFDHITGIPVITGHNLKGRIRSFFPISYNVENKKNAIAKRLLHDLMDCFKGDESIEIEKWSISEICHLENIIFEGKYAKDKRINPLIQDTFLGAYPSKSNSVEFTFAVPKLNEVTHKYDLEQSEKIQPGTFLFDDTLAHHPHPLKDPMPIRFLKILPDIEITFQFRLNNEGGLSAKQKALFFNYLLNKYGAGAKTSSGYGQFRKQQEKDVSSKILSTNPMFENFNPITIDNSSAVRKEILVPKELTKKLPAIEETNDWIPLESLKNGSVVSGTVVDFLSGNAKIQLHIKGHTITLGLQGKFLLHDVVRLKIVETSGSLVKGNYQINKITKA